MGRLYGRIMVGIAAVHVTSIIGTVSHPGSLTTSNASFGNVLSHMHRGLMMGTAIRQTLFEASIGPNVAE